MRTTIPVNSHPTHANSKGFTLIEVMITVVIIGILASIAVPSYSNYVLRGKRSEGRAFLMDAAAQQERFYSDCNRYGTLAGARNCGTGVAGISTSSETGLYNLAVGNLGANNQTFTLTATPTFDDPGCGNLTITQAGTRGESGTLTVNECWGK